MADIKSINGYSLKDETARSSISTIESSIDTMQSSIDELVELTSDDNNTTDEINVYDSSTITEGYRLSQVNSNAPTEKEDSGYFLTDYIPIKNKQTFNLLTSAGKNSIIYSYSFCVYAIYDSDKAYLSAFKTPTYESDGTTYFYGTLKDAFGGTPTISNVNCAYIRFAVPIAYKNDLQIIKNWIDPSTVVDTSNPINQALPAGGGYIGMFRRIACVGDSLTFGALEWNNSDTAETTTITDSSSYSYPNILAKMCGNTVYTLARSGAMATDPTDYNYNSWNQTATSNGWLTDDYKADAYIIALGTNDIPYEGFSGDLSTDIDDDDYTNNATTAVGGYAKIIQRIQELQSRAKIFCCTIPYSRNTSASVEAANELIRSIAEKFGCYVIDLEKYLLSEDEKTTYKAKYYCVGHLNCLGYRHFAEAIAKCVNAIIDANADEFYDVPAIETDLT